MSIDENIQGWDNMEDFEENPFDPTLFYMTEHEFWPYLQMIMSHEPMEIESLDSSTIDENDISIDSPTWSDDDSDFDFDLDLNSNPYTLSDDTPYLIVDDDEN